MDRDQHSSSEQGAGEGSGDRPRDLHTGLPREHHGNGESDASDPDAATSDSQLGVRTDAIMSKLPRTRPQRVTGRRPRPEASGSRETAQGAAKRAPRRTTAASRTAAARGNAQAQRSAPGRPKSRAGTAARAAKQPSRATPAARARPAQRQPSAPGSTARTGPVPEPAPQRTGGNGAPGLPRLALDGAVEAAKVPLKVGGRLTLRALDAVARSLRGG